MVDPSPTDVNERAQVTAPKSQFPAWGAKRLKFGIVVHREANSAVSAPRPEGIVQELKRNLESPSTRLDIFVYRIDG